jgi:hypothetical protein
MTSSSLFIDRIRVLCRGFIKGDKGNNTALNRPRNYEVRILPSSMQGDSRQSRSSGLLAIKLEHTRSNLG